MNKFMYVREIFKRDLNSGVIVILAIGREAGFFYISILRPRAQELSAKKENSEVNANP